MTSARRIAQAPARPGEICLLHMPKENAAVTWSKVFSCFYADTQLPKRMEFYDEKDRKVRVLEYDEVKTLGGRLLPTRMTLTPLSEDKLGNKTVMSFEEMQFGVEVKATTFSEANLRRGTVHTRSRGARAPAHTQARGQGRAHTVKHVAATWRTSLTRSSRLCAFSIASQSSSSSPSSTADSRSYAC